MKLYEALVLAKEDSTKRITNGNIVMGYAPRFNQFYELEQVNYCVYIRTIDTRELFEDGWELVN